jgi:ABC-2 type transport system ATP-binding protein
MNGDLAIDVKNLSVAFNDFYAVRKISFQVKRGEIFGFLGANGAGKTTTIRVLCGLLRPSSGDVKVSGISFDSGEMAIKKKVGYMSQKFTLYNDLSIEENLSFTASLRKMSRKTYLDRQRKILDFISFDRPLNSMVRDLSGGVKQQVALAASILHDPEIVFLDEPTAGVTPAARARFWALLKQLASEDKTIFITTHYMDEAEQCERIALMGAGEIIALDSPTNLKNQAFPSGILEMTPLETGTFARIRSLRSHKAFQYFEPYGLRFHACFVEASQEEALLRDLKKEFQILKITPSLEDVFIRLVEDKNR